MDDRTVKFINGDKDPLILFDLIARCIIEHEQEKSAKDQEYKEAK